MTGSGGAGGEVVTGSTPTGGGQQSSVTPSHLRAPALACGEERGPLSWMEARWGARVTTGKSDLDFVQRALTPLKGGRKLPSCPTSHPLTPR